MKKEMLIIEIHFNFKISTIIKKHRCLKTNIYKISNTLFLFSFFLVKSLVINRKFRFHAVPTWTISKGKASQRPKGCLNLRSFESKLQATGPSWALSILILLWDYFSSRLQFRYSSGFHLWCQFQAEVPDWGNSVNRPTLMTCLAPVAWASSRLISPEDSLPYLPLPHFEHLCISNSICCQPPTTSIYPTDL